MPLILICHFSETNGYDLDYAWYVFSSSAPRRSSYSIKNIPKHISHRKRSETAFLKNLSHISSHTRLIKIHLFSVHFLKICMHTPKKTGKWNLWLFRLKSKWYQTASLGRRVHIMKCLEEDGTREGTTFPYAIAIISFNFCETLFFLFSFENIIYCIRFCFISFSRASYIEKTTSVTLHLIDLNVCWFLRTTERMGERRLWKCDKSMSKFSSKSLLRN